MKKPVAVFYTKTGSYFLRKVAEFQSFKVSGQHKGKHPVSKRGYPCKAASVVILIFRFPCQTGQTTGCGR